MALANGPEAKGDQMNHSKLSIRFIPGTHGGWTMACPGCPAVAARSTWQAAMLEADKHLAVHRHPSYLTTTTAAAPPTAAFRWLS